MFPQMAELPMRIRRLILKRFRSVPAEAVDLSNPTFLVGKNGAGKSNVVDAFAFLSECMALPLQAVFDKRGGISIVRHRSGSRSYPPNLGIGVEFQFSNGTPISGHYAFEIKALPNYGFQVVREQCRIVSRTEVAWFDQWGIKAFNPVSGDWFRPWTRKLSHYRLLVAPKSLRPC